MRTWNILYRGSLSSCNYDCGYCPFAKTSNTKEQLEQDRVAFERFTDWVAVQTNRIGILITPWGEALVHSYYRRGMAKLSHLPHVYRVSIQTNLSAPIDELTCANPRSLALWTTFHPSQISLTRFLERCQELDVANIRYSVGAVGLREHFDAIEELRQRLRPEVYVWINAYKFEPNYYADEEISRLLEVDPYFGWNLKDYASAGKPCYAGESTFTIDADGHIRRCHFIDEVIGNIYDDGFENCLKPRVCTAAICDCHIGYIHRPELNLHSLYRDGLLERIPATWPQVDPLFSGQGTTLPPVRVGL
jgi:MoaA/NifB/PqqE/SkfB family radical SAM enzyme